MGYVAVGGGTGDWAPTKYVRYTHPQDRELNEKDLLLKQDQSLEGWFLKSYERQTQHGTKWNHVIVDEAGTHLVIPDNKDVTKIFLGDRIVQGARTRFTFLGKESFKTKSGQTAKAVKALVEQDRTNIVEFEGTDGRETIKGKNPIVPNTQAAEPAITTESVPF